MIHIVIIDDETFAREIVKDYLQRHEDVEIVGEFADGFSGLKGIQELKPELVILDIQMPKLTGFELLELLDERPAILFSTAYDQYAISAFEQNAVDYLLKPFSADRFDEALRKARERINRGKTTEVDKIIKAREERDEVLNRVVVKTRSGIKLIPVDEILFLEAQDDYVMVHLKEERYLKQKTMNFFEAHLPASDFLRVHRSYMVRIDQINRIEPYEKAAGILLLKDGKKVPVSRSGLSRLKEVLDL